MIDSSVNHKLSRVRTNDISGTILRLGPTYIKGSDCAGSVTSIMTRAFATQILFFCAQNRYGCLPSFTVKMSGNNWATSIQRNVCGHNGNYQVSSLRDKNNQKWPANSWDKHLKAPSADWPYVSKLTASQTKIFVLLLNQEGKYDLCN